MSECDLPRYLGTEGHSYCSTREVSRRIGCSPQHTGCTGPTARREVTTRVISPHLSTDTPHHRVSTTMRQRPSEHCPTPHPAGMWTVAGGLIVALVVGLLDPPPALWHWPVVTSKDVVRDFDAPESEWGPGHRGLDLRARPGTTVVAPVSGRVSFSGSVVDRVVITITTPSGAQVTLEPVELDDSPPDRIRAGARIGVVARGHCPGGCLHIGLRVEGDYRSPARELGIVRRAVLVD